MIHTFRSVPLHRLGRAVGYAPDGLQRIVMAPCYSGSGQLVNVEVGIEVEDGAWSAAILTVKRSGSPTADAVGLGVAKTIVAGDVLASVTGVDFPYVSIDVTTANASVAYATITLTITDGGN